MSQPLIPCPSCDRHVFADASACPFCTARLESREGPPRATASPGPRRLGRAALLAAGAALVGAAACDSSIAPPYGIPPDFDASTDAPSSPGGKGGGAGGHGGVAGAPAEADAGTSHLVAPLSDAGAPMPRKRGP
jgi:hypothetical protein